MRSEPRRQHRKGGRPEPADVLAANLHGARDGERVGNILDTEAGLLRRKYGTEPTAVVLTEARFLFDALPAIARHLGLVVYQERPGDHDARPMPEAGSSALLLPKGWRTWTIGLDQEWEVFSAGVRHRPRRVPAGVGPVPIDGWDEDLKILGCHGPTNGFGGGNRAAFTEYADRIEAAKNNTREGVLVAAIGDHNEKIPALRRRFPEATVKGKNVDSTIGWGFRRIDVSDGPKYKPMDHPFMRYRLHPA